MFFNDELPMDPIIPDEEVEILFRNRKDETGTAVSVEEFEKIYEYLEQLKFNIMLYEMCLDGLLIMKYDFEKNDIVYSATKEGNKLAENFKENSDRNAVNGLLNSLEENND